MNAVQDILETFGMWTLPGALLGVVIIWGVTHLLAQPGEPVSVLWGLVTYTKGGSSRRAPEGPIEVDYGIAEGESASGDMTKPGADTESENGTAVAGDQAVQTPLFTLVVRGKASEYYDVREDLDERKLLEKYVRPYRAGLLDQSFSLHADEVLSFRVFEQVPEERSSVAHLIRASLIGFREVHGIDMTYKYLPDAGPGEFGGSGRRGDYHVVVRVTAGEFPLLALYRSEAEILEHYVGPLRDKRAFTIHGARIEPAQVAEVRVLRSLAPNEKDDNMHEHAMEFSLKTGRDHYVRMRAHDLTSQYFPDARS